ncbi:MAG TPA: Asp/Glu racemase [Epulopiscium sp.]|nr:Asp/Glu racemase [Candidatus Epulonipiscium sp.]
MKKLILINTVKPVVATFEDKIREKMPNIEISNILDEFIAKNLNKKEGFEEEDYSRLLTLIKLAEDTKPDAILATCSSLSMAIDYLKPMISVPIYKIDEAMLNQAVDSGKKITVLATADSTIGPTETQLHRIAKSKGKTIEVEHKVFGPAYEAMKRGEGKVHDMLVLTGASELKNVELIVLAQASMGHLEEEMRRLCKCEVLGSPRLAVDLIVEKLS